MYVKGLGAFGEALESVKGHGMEIAIAPSVYSQMAKIYLRMGTDEPKSKPLCQEMAKQVISFRKTLKSCREKG